MEAFARLKLFFTQNKLKFWATRKEAKFIEFFEILSKVCKIHGYDYFERPPSNFREQCIAILNEFLSYIGRIVLLLSMVVYIIWIAVNANDLDGLLRAIPNVSNNTFVAARFFILHRNGERLQRMYSTLFEAYEDLDVKHSKHARKQLRNTRNIQSFSVVILIFTQLSQIIEFVTNYIRYGTEIFTVQIWLPWDPNRSEINYFMSCLWISISGLFCSSALFIGDWTIYSITTVASTEFRMIGIKFREILSESNVELKHLALVLRHHNRIVDVCNQLEEIVSAALLHNCLQGTIIICLVCFQIVILEDPMQLIVYGLVLVIVFSQIFLMCYHGEMMIGSSMSVGDAIYDSKWDEIDDINVKKSIPFMLQFCHAPKYLTARGFARISVALCTSVSFLKLEL